MRYRFGVVLLIISLILVSGGSVWAAEVVKAVIESREVSYDNKESHGSYQDVQESIDELYRRSGILDKEWKDPILNGADPLLGEDMVPVTIDDDGTVQYANLYTKWYEYETKRWANAVILTDDGKKKDFKTGDKIDEEYIESYFVWIPRYKYKIWDLGDYTSAYNFSDLKDLADLAKNEDDTAARRITENTRLIDIVFGDTTKIKKMEEREAQLNEYYTHPAFTLGEKELNGIWVGKFEITGDINNITVKPEVVSVRNQTLGTFWNKLYDYKRDLDSHMMKNTEWGAVAYLSHSIYGIGREVNINNNSEFKTGYSAVITTNQSSYPGEVGISENITKPYNTIVGYLASTTGNITGIYDMNGGAWEFAAAYKDDSLLRNGLSGDELKTNSRYFDKYANNSSIFTYNNRILGDATGEMGPFYLYYDKDGAQRYHNTWYSDNSSFVDNDSPWFIRGCHYGCGILGGQFYFERSAGSIDIALSTRLVLAVK